MVNVILSLIVKSFVWLFAMYVGISRELEATILDVSNQVNGIINSLNISGKYDIMYGTFKVA